jgi:hypothetical protein
MLRINKAYREVIKEKIREGRIEGAALGGENFVDIIIKKMKGLGIIEDLKLMIADKRADNARIPLELIWALDIDAKRGITAVYRVISCRGWRWRRLFTRWIVPSGR